MTRPLAALCGLLLLPACSAGLTETARITAVPVASTEALERTSDAGLREEAELFLAEYTRRWLPLRAASAEAEWEANTRIVPGDTTAAARVRRTNEALAAYTGSVDVIARARALLERREALTDLQARQLDAVLYAAASSPQTVPALVRERIAEEAAQTERLYGYTFTLGGAELSPNEIDRRLVESDSLPERLAVWEASKALGPTLTDGLERLVGLRNGTVQALGYDNFFAYQAADYGVTSDEMLARMRQINAELRPLYRELHTWTRHTLAARYGQPVPEHLPAHWLPNRWGQDWSALAAGSAAGLDGALEGTAPEEIVRQADRFYQSLGFEALPASFYARSSNFPLPPDAPVKKNTHASAWHMDLDRDVRTLMSVEPTAEWFETTHHELGHVHYYLAYATPAVPPLLRAGADRAYHEAVGSLLGLAAMQPRALEAAGLAPGGPAPDAVQTLLREALNYVVFIPFATGTMTMFEHDLYAEGIPPDEWNARWWELAREYQGIVPPDPARAAFGAPFNDAATKTHINDDPAQYYDYALSFVLLFQLHDHIAREVLAENPRDANYFGRPEVGAFLNEILRPGATVDGDELLRRTTGRGLTAEPMLDYFAPLLEWLRAENAGRTHTL